MGRRAAGRATSGYDRRFFDFMTGGAARSAAVVVPLLVELTRPASVVDVGCGAGAWLRAFQEQGVARVQGLDGAWLRPEQLVIAPACFRPTDLARPFALDDAFDLALCLEVAEHLPPGRAEGLVADLTRLAPVVAFSAAIPHQGGEHHVNERWQSYWVELFARHDYVALDCLRARVWRDEAVDPWYAQNLLLYARADALAADAPLARLPRANPALLDLVHPRVYSERLLATANPRRLLCALPAATRRAIGRRGLAPRRWAA